MNIYLQHCLKWKKIRNSLSKHLAIDDCINKIGCIYIVEYCLSISNCEVISEYLLRRKDFLQHVE